MGKGIGGARPAHVGIFVFFDLGRCSTKEYKGNARNLIPRERNKDLEIKSNVFWFSQSRFCFSVEA